MRERESFYLDLVFLNKLLVSAEDMHVVNSKLVFYLIIEESN